LDKPVVNVEDRESVTEKIAALVAQTNIGWQRPTSVPEKLFNIEWRSCVST
jgi:hypothetical protein